jgi:hypothetical protein
MFGTAEGAEWQWDVVEKPPTLSNPKLIDASELHAIHSAGWKRFFTRRATDKLLCDGRIYKIILDDDVDAIVYMSGDQPLVYPMHVTGGQNVRIVGLQFELETQQGCDVGELPNLPVKKHPNANIHPRIPGAIALRVEQHRTTFMEGLHIDVRGHEADCIVSRNPDDMTDAIAQQQRDVIVQNTWCSGVEGLGKSKIGDGVHGDLFQNQGRDIMRRLVFENVSMRTSQEGIVLHGKGRLPGALSLVMRRYDYTWDSRYVGDDDYEHFGLAFAGEAPADGWTLDTIYIDAYRDGLDYMNIDGQRYGNSPSSRVWQHTEIFSGPPPGGAFAPPEHTGVHYVTPHEPLPRR